MRIKFIEKNLAEISSFMRWGFWAEFYVQKNGLLQKINPRIKIISLFAMLIIINLSHNIAFLVSVYLLFLILSLLSKVNLDFFLRKVLVLLPLFTVVLFLPSVLSIAVKGTPLIHITSNIYISYEGIRLLIINILRVLNSVSLVILINLTTSWSQILYSLKFFKIPEVFITILNMSYRYLYLLIKTQEEAQTAIKSRTLRKPTLSEAYKATGRQIITGFNKSASMTDQIYNAMKSRGYTAHQD